MSLEPEKNETFASFGEDFQKKVVQALLQDHLFAEQMSDVLQPGYFEYSALQEMVNAFYEYKNKYRAYPSPEILEVFLKQNVHSKDVQEEAGKYLKNFSQNPLNGDNRFVQDSSLDFCRRQTLKIALLKTIDLINNKDYDSIHTLVKNALNKGVNRDLGHEYLKDAHLRRHKEERKRIPTGWRLLNDQLNGGLAHKTLSTIIGPSGSGKSMLLVNISAAAVEQGFNSLYISCEMSELEIGSRHDTYFSGIPINELNNNKEALDLAIKDKVRGGLFIKEFPTKTATVQTIRAFMQRLRAVHNFVPDILVVDYADLLRSSRNYGEKRHELEANYEELRSLAQEQDIVVVTADQTNRTGSTKEFVDLNDVAESFNKIMVCDLVLTISRRTEDKLNHGGRLHIAKSRLGASGVVFPIFFNPALVKLGLMPAMTSGGDGHGNESSEELIEKFRTDNKALAKAAAESLLRNKK